MSEYAGLEEFYGEPVEGLGAKRKGSPECDYGVMWREGEAPWPNWRVSYVKATGEVYALELGGAGRLRVLGIVPPDEPEPSDGDASWVEAPYYRTVERILHGWADLCHEPGGLEWVRGRLVAAPEATA